MSLESRNRPPDNEQVRLAGKRPILFKRFRILQAIRRFFSEHGYLEVETPYLISAPAPEVHIDAINAGHIFLHTSPELCMKRLMAAGYGRIFQISKCFRQGERGERHLPEFTMLEWYREGIDYNAIMDECEALVSAVTGALGAGKETDCFSCKINFRSPWKRIAVEEAFCQYSSITPEEAVRENRFDEIMVQEIEPHLGFPSPTFLYDYPSSLASLARLKRDNRMVAERFELYMAGMEVANGFSELTDETEQRARFEEDIGKRSVLGKDIYPMAENFLAALGFMPECAGIALGIDRLLMI